MVCTELSIDIPPESPLASSKKSKKRKAKDGGGGKDKKPKRSKSKSAAKGDKVVEMSYEDASDADDDPMAVPVCLLCHKMLVAHYSEWLQYSEGPQFQELVLVFGIRFGLWLGLVFYPYSQTFGIAAVHYSGSESIKLCTIHQLAE